MKIAVLGKVVKKTAPNGHTGTDVFTYALVEELVKRGHDVTLYGAADSEVSATLKSITDSKTAQIEIGNENLARPITALLAQKLAQDSDQYDLIHNSLVHSYYLMLFSPFIKVPIVHTIHYAFYQNDDWKKLFRLISLKDNEEMVFVSHHARELAAEVQHAQVIHNGIDISKFPFQSESSDYCLWLGRMSEEKGPIDAIDASSAAGKRLILNSVRYTPKEEAYADEVARRLSSHSELKQESDSAKKLSLFQNAKVFLLPIHWEEPFGLVMLEAMSSGTPVIAYSRGAVPEIIKDGETGFIVNPSDDDIRGEYIVKKTGVAGLQEAIERTYALSPEAYQVMRQASRKHVEDFFSLSTMISRYEALYSKLLSSR